jgi:hypothetical protein
MLDSDLEFLRHHHADHLGHSGGSLLEHLRGTAALLDDWGMPAHVVRAGLFHSVYGTAAYDEAVVSPARRAAIRDLIGGDAEAIVHLFCTLDRDSIFRIYDLASPGEPAARCWRTGRTVELERDLARALLHVVSANWLEQRTRLQPALRRARCGDYERLLPFLEPPARASVAAAIEATLAEPVAPTLVELFAFRDADLVDACCSKLDVDYLALVSNRLNQLADRATLARLDALPDDGYLAILRAAETCFHLTGDEDLAGYLEGALQVEEWRAGRRTATDRPAWSATGDVYLPAGRIEAIVSEDFAPDRAYAAPILGGWIAADFHSPAARRQLEQLAYKRVPFGPPEPYSDAERAYVLDKLRGAVAGIERTNPIASRFLRYTLHTLIPRKQTDPALYPNSFKGSSTAATLHRANIYNVQQPNVDVARIAQSLIHESVHNHLYKRERFAPTVVDLAAAEALRVTSPWSGNTLDLYVFVHSSIVYYALHSFFSHPDAPEHLPAETVEWFRARAVQGYRNPAWAAIAGAHRDLIAPDIRRDLWAMRAAVIGAAR